MPRTLDRELLSPDFQAIQSATAIVHPRSTTAARGSRRLNRFIKAAPFPVDKIFTSRDQDATKQHIQHGLETSDALIVVAGDGTFNTVVRTIVGNGLSVAAKSKPILTLGGGNAEDGHKAKHPREHRRRPELVLQEGRIVETYPIRCDVTTAEGEHQLHSAAFYASLGVTALTSSKLYLNRPKHRDSLLTGRNKIGRILSEPLISFRAIKNAGMSHIEQEGMNESFLELIFANSHIMAKYGKFPTRLTDHELFITTVPDKTVRDIGTSILKLVQGTMPGDYLKPDEIYGFGLLDDTWAQFDGEAVLLPAGSDVSYRIHDDPLRVITTNPNL